MEKAEGKNIKNNNIKSNFSTTANIFVRNIFLRLLNLIFEPIYYLLMLFKATSVYYLEGCAPPSRLGPSTPRPRPGNPSPWTPFNFRTCSAAYLTHKKPVRGKGKVSFYSSAIFFIGHFFPWPFFPLSFFPDTE